MGKLWEGVKEAVGGKKNGKRHDDKNINQKTE
jgi:hypothetical protein